MGDDHLAAALRRADLLLDANRHGEALQSLSSALAAHPDEPDLHALVARCHLGLERGGKEALAHAERVVALAPDSEHGYRLQALAHLELGNRRKGMDSARRAVELAPDMWLTHYVLGTAALGDRLSNHIAIEAAYRSLQLAPDQAEAHVLSARVMLYSGARPSKEDREEAVSHLREALRIDPHNADAVRDLASVQLAANNPTDAMTGYLGALRLDPQSSASVAGLSQAVVAWVWRAHIMLWLVGLVVVRMGLKIDGSQPGRGGRDIILVVSVAALGVVIWVVARLARATDGRGGAVMRATWRGDPLGALWAMLLVPVALGYVVVSLLPVPQGETVLMGALVTLGAGVALSWLRLWPGRR